MTVILGADGKPLAMDTAYRGASHTARTLSSWNPYSGSPDADLIDELPTLVARSRDLVRNHGVAAGAVQTLTDNVVGAGLRLSATPDYKALGKTKEWADDWAHTVESLWRSWAETTACDAAHCLTFAGLTTQVFRSVLINGEALALPLWLAGKNNPFATTMQLVEPDRLQTPAEHFGNHNIRGGIESNRYGEPQAYWIAKTHPGEQWLGVDYQRIPAKTAFGRLRVLHVCDRERSGQSRGKPLLTPVMSLFKMLDSYEQAELQAALFNAMIAAFIETPLDGEAIGELFGSSTQDYLAARNAWEVKLQAGAVIPIFPGDKVSSFTPNRPNSGYGHFVENVLRHIGTGLNLPFELLMKDFSKTNYASARASLMEAWRYFIGRRQWLATYWARPVYSLWLEEVINKGLIEAPKFYHNPALYTRSKWIGPGRGWIDPVKEAKASQIRLDTGLSTLEDECAAQGHDWEEVMEQHIREQTKKQSFRSASEHNAQ